MEIINQRKDGLKHGTWVEAIGGSRRIGEYLHGEKQGEWKSFRIKNRESVLYSITEYKDDMRHGVYLEYKYKDSIPHISTMGEFKNDERYGNWYNLTQLFYLSTNHYEKIWERKTFRHKYYLKNQPLTYNQDIPYVSIKKDCKGRVIKIFNTTQIFAQVRYKNNKIISYQDYKGNWYDNKIAKGVCQYNIEDLYSIQIKESPFKPKGDILTPRQTESLNKKINEIHEPIR